MKSLAHELMSAGQVILISEYESVIVNQSSKDSVTLPEAHFMLQAHELRLEQFNSSIGL